MLLVQTEGTENGETFAKVQSRLAPSMCMQAGKSKEVARGSIVNAQSIAVQEAWTSCDQADFLTSRHKIEVFWEVSISPSSREVKTRFPREGGHQCCDHRSKKREECGIREIFSSFPCLAKAGLVRERVERVYVGEEVVDQGI